MSSIRQWFSGRKSVSVEPLPSKRETAVIAVPLLTQHVGEAHHLVRNNLSGETHRLDSSEYALLVACAGLRPPSEHRATYADSFGLHESELQEIWKSLTAKRLLVSRTELLSQLNSIERTTSLPQPVTALGIPTANRPDMMVRVLNSFLTNVITYGRKPSFSFFDDSDEAMTLPEGWHSQIKRAENHGIRVKRMTRVHKEKALVLLAKHSGVDIETCRFGLIPEKKNSLGANRNWMILCHAGEQVITLDDDVLCQIRRAGDFNDKAVVTNYIPAPTRLFNSMEEAWQSSEPLALDFIELHQTLLNRSPISLMEQFGDLLEIDELPEKIISSIAPRVAISLMGFVGDSASHFNNHLITGSQETRHQLAQCNQAYETLIESRAVASHQKSVVIGKLMGAGMAAGLDLAADLPPFFPTYRLQDIVFQTMAWNHGPGNWVGRLPYMVEHRPMEGRVYEHSVRSNPVVRPFWGSWFISLINDIKERQGITHYSFLSRHLLALGQSKPDDFLSELRRISQQFHARGLVQWETYLSKVPKSEILLRNDMERWLHETRTLVKTEGWEFPSEHILQVNPLAAMQADLRGYALFLDAWPQLTKTMQTLKHDIIPEMI